MITKLGIDRLRGFGHFELHDLGRINLLVGTNNCGKTTVLESIQIVSSPGDPYSIFRILSRRGEDWRDTTERGRMTRHVDIRRLFFGHEIEKGSKFSVQATADIGSPRFVAEIIDAPAPLPGTPSLFEPEVGTGDAEELLSPAALRMTWNENSETDFAVTISRKGGLASDALRRIAAGGEGGEGTRLVTTASLSPESVIDLFENIVLTPEEDLVIEAIRLIEPSIERIATCGSDRTRVMLSETARGGMLVRCKGILS